MGRKTKKTKQKHKSPKKTCDGGADKDGRLEPNASDSAESKPAKYTVDQLLEKANAYIDTFELPLAQRFCERALEMEPDNIRGLQTSGTLLIELGELHNAKCCFGRAIELQPDSGHSKYMYMGQLLTGMEAVQCFCKGIKLMEAYLEAQKANEAAAASPDSPADGAKDPTPRDISQAHCSVAEIYLTDACFEEDAEAQCRSHLEHALQSDPLNAEAHHLMASFCLSQDNKQAAAESLEKGLSLWLPQLKEAHAEEEGDGSEVDPVQACQVSYQGRINAAKLLIELQKYEAASEVLELLLDEEEMVMEVWYLLGWANYLQGDDFKSNARFYLNKAKEVFDKVPCDDQDMVAHAVELLAELGPGDDQEGDEEEEVDDDLDMDMDSNHGDGDHDNQTQQTNGKPKDTQQEHMEH